MNIRLNMNPAQQILLERGMQNGGSAQRFLTHEVRRLCDPYVPMLSGVMKNTAIESVDKITYPQVYSQRQYHENKGNGLRGKEWDRRMMADHGDDVVDSVANFVGGRRG